MMEGRVTFMGRDDGMVRIQGIVTNQDNQVLRQVRLQLLKKVKKNKRFYYIHIQQGTTNDQGEYRFKVTRDERAQYKILVLDEMPQIDENRGDGDSA